MIKKILILQPEYTRRYPSTERLFLNNVASRLLSPLSKMSPVSHIRARYFSAQKVPLTMEFLFYGELPNLLGAENVYAIDRYHPCYVTSHPETFRYLDWQNYPSNFGYPAPTFISVAQAQAMLKQFDAVLASFYCGSDVRPLLRMAKHAGILTAVLDCIDHERIYFSDDADSFRHYQSDEFDLFFKKDIPLWETDTRLLPLSPIPVKPFPIPYDISNWSQREHDLFFVGSYRKGVTRKDRLQLCEIMQKSFPKSKIIVNQPPLDPADHFRYIDHSKILLSPMGRVWDSYRHAQYGLHALPIILAEPDCKTLEPKYVDGYNCILYQTVKRDGEVLMANPDELIKKVAYYLAHESEALQLGKNLRRDVLNGHTTRNRAQYILDCLNAARTPEASPR